MCSFKTKTIVSALLLIMTGQASSAVLTPDDMSMINKSQAIMAAAAEGDAPDWLKTYDAEKSVENNGSGWKKWNPVAEKIAQNSNDFVTKSIAKTYGVIGDERNKIHTLPSTVRADSPLKKGEELYYFISFSESEKEIKEIMQAAADADARIILRGMRPQDKYVNQTSYAINVMGKDIRPVPKVAIDPRLFKVFKITKAPMMVYRKGDKYVVGSGITTTNWFLNKSREVKENYKTLGNLSPTKPIVEKDLIEEIKSRVAKIDWEAKRKKAMDHYFEKLPSFYLPPAQVDKTYEIDPRVRFNKDVRTKAGKLLAKKDSVVNPMDYFPGKTLNLFVFNPQSNMQKAVVKQQMKLTKGENALLVTGIDKEKGLNSIRDISDEMGLQVYLLQERMIKRFQLQHSPSKVVLGNGKITITEYGTRSQNIALDDLKMIEIEDAQLINKKG
ncbi:hypothetical protein GLP21_18470 [Photobacterium carnosum]|uniref:Conjugal transfer protein TraW n=1 Tax=Photobacterium carnosum TaxID=2023717 RepID=A0A2N4UWK7_9GAMM|nr:MULTISPECIES: TrbC family F-type conjugative pilus assembly protein [Photobacterium]MCD9476334.1 hypothetical protein [Photobacterium phosphoreum]MCD9488883.1 hypothetical protein [Photobacterium iliopiscarium]MCD9508110.1 hypothetical protein [Photobacterium phosphoreum]MCD9539333.1 hypothetical protein [Photobacterium carnosum]MCD9542315.1 hypothetical protein [Photobacterium carnosum]